MPRPRQISANIFTGGLDKDSDPLVVNQADYIHAQDILNGYGGTIGAIIFPKGNTEVTLPLEVGENLCIGCIEDKQSASALIFIWNENADHKIIWWRPLHASGTTVRVIAFGSALAFTGTLLITHASVVDSKLLYWTDASYQGGAIDGQPPRELDIVTGDMTEKDTMWEIYAGQVGENQFAAGNTYAIGITDGVIPILFNIFISIGTNVDDPQGGLQWLKGLIETSDLNDVVEMELCECKLTIKLLYGNLPDAAYNRLYFEASADDVIAVGINLYPDPLQSFMIDLIKRPANCAPHATYVHSDLTSANNVQALCAQFIVRYIYRTGARSAWSPVSNIALGTNTVGEINETLNAIEIDFTDVRLSDPNWLFLIRSVEIAFRDGNINEFKLIDRFDVCEIGIQRQKIVFLNDKLYNNVESDDVSTDVSTQVLKLFDPVPLLCGTLTMAADNQGNNLMFLGANLEGYDCPDCIEMEVEAVPLEDECLFDVSGIVIVQNAADNASDPFKETPDYDIYPLGGFVVYLVGTNFYAISENPADGTGTGRFKIQNVPRGIYIVRVASFRCDFAAPIAPRYDLNNGLEWQRTSAPCIQVVDPANLYEFVLDLTTFAGTEYDFEVENAPGQIIVQNGHYSSRRGNVTGTRYYVFYEQILLDNEALDTDAATRIGALNCEIQQRSTGTGAGTPAGNKCDHNGYIFGIVDATIGIDSWTLISDYVHLEDTDPRAMYVGDYDAMYADTLINIPALEVNFTNFSWGVFFVINKDEDFTARKRALDVSAEDSNGNPLAGVLILYERTTRFVITGTIGTGRIVAYAEYNDVPRTDDLIVFYENDQCYVSYPAGDNPRDIVFDPLTTPETPQVESPFVFDVTLIVFTNPRYLKAGGIYDFGIVYEDDQNRTCGVSKGFRLYVPFHIGGLTRYQARWSISSQPPDWARHFRIVRTRNAYQQTYVQWAITEVLYARIPSQIEPPIITNFAAGDYTHIMLRLFIPPTASADPQLTLFWQQDGQQGYTPVRGDFARIILDNFGNALTTASVLYEAPIVGMYVDGEKIYAVIEAVFGNLEVKPGFLFEYLTPKLNVEEVYYEGGEDCYDILDPTLSSRRHAGPIQDQMLDPTPQPAKGMLTGGDTYWRRQLFTATSLYLTEHYSPNRLLTDPCEDIGRAFIYDADAEQLYFYNRIRFSGKYVPNSNTNDLGSFGQLDYQDINRQWGQIKWLGLANNVLLAICEFKFQPLYLNKNQLLYLSGDFSVGRSDKTVNIADESRSDYGTRNPESVVVEGGVVTAWDAYQGTPVRYSQAGVLPIAQKMVKYFRDLGRARLEIYNGGNDFVLGGYDRRYAMYVISFYDPRDEITYTLGYDDAKNAWVSFYSYLPEMMGRVGQDFISFKAGEMWQHHTNALNCNFYGVQYKPKVQFVSNAMPGEVKLYFSLRILTNRGWNAPVITLPSNLNYADGMESRLKSNKFQKLEGVLAADFLRDMLDTSKVFRDIVNPVTRATTALLAGRNLRGQCMIITLEADYGNPDTLLQRVDVYFVPSEETNT